MSYREFLAALSNVYVRTSEEDGSRIDTRDERVAELAQEQVTGEMLTHMEPSDLAAMLSASVCVVNVPQAKTLKAKSCTKCLHELKAKGKLPLASKPDHPAGAVLEKLLSTEEGCLVYVKVAVYLTQAKQERLPGIYGQSKTIRPRDELITAPPDPEAQPLDEEDGEGSTAWATN